MVAESVPCGPHLERHVEVIESYADAGFHELYIQQIGGGDERFFETYAREVLPRFRGGAENGARGRARVADPARA